jgi:hypothetical protein
MITRMMPWSGISIDARENESGGFMESFTLVRLLFSGGKSVDYTSNTEKPRVKIVPQK